MQNIYMHETHMALIEPSCLSVSLSDKMPSHQVSQLDCGLYERDLPNWREIYGSVKSLDLGSCVLDFILKEVFIILIIKRKWETFQH